MAGFGFDVALGREVEFWNRVNDSDPTNAVLVLMVLASSGIEADAGMRVRTTFADILGASTNEVTNSGYSRKILSDSDIGPPVVDNTYHTITLNLANQTFSTIVAGDAWSKYVLGYDSDSTGGSDSNVIPILAQDIRKDGAAVVPNGNNIIIGFPTGVAVAS